MKKILVGPQESGCESANTATYPTDNDANISDTTDRSAIDDYALSDLDRSNVAVKAREAQRVSVFSTKLQFAIDSDETVQLGGCSFKAIELIEVSNILNAHDSRIARFKELRDALNVAHATIGIFENYVSPDAEVQIEADLSKRDLTLAAVGAKVSKALRNAYMEGLTPLDKFNYQLLSRLKSDCDYYLGHGNRSNNRLWAGDVSSQIQKMKEVYEQLPETPEWITLEDIDKYETAMTSDEMNNDKIVIAEREDAL